MTNRSKCQVYIESFFYMNYKTVGIYLPIDLGQNGFSVLSSALVIVEENIPAIHTLLYKHTRASARHTLF